MSNQDLIDEFAKMVDDIENTVDELNKNLSTSDEEEILKDLSNSFQNMRNIIDHYIKQ